MTLPYVDLVHAYVRDGDETTLAAIGELRSAFIETDLPIEDLVGLHERAMLGLRDRVTPETFDDVIVKSCTCLTELMIAYSLADQKRKGLHERLQRIERERHRLEALGQMAGGVAHEFNNLLQPIMGMAEMALEDAAPGSELAEQMGTVLDCAGQAATVVRGVLTTARRQGPEPRPLVFAALLRKSVQFLAAIMSQGITLDLAIECTDERVRCDDGELAQVLLNLVRNASDAMRSEGRVRISLRREDRAGLGAATGSIAAMACLRLGVADEGTGMSADVAARVFQPFFTTKSPDRGTGLGLSIVMAIAEGWGATLEIDTAPGEGTRISMLLPIEEDSTPPAGTVSQDCGG